MSELKPFFIYFRAKKKSGQKDLVFWETRATENRVIRDAVNAMEDADLSEDDFFSPVVTNFHVVDELPPEGEIDTAWCELYQLGDDKMTWEVIPGAASASVDTNVVNLQRNDNTLPQDVNLEDLTVEQAVISAWLFGRKDSLSKDELSAVNTAMMDADASFPQNLLLVARSAQVMQLQHAYKSTVADWVDSAKSVWSPDGTAPQLADLLKFTSEWLDAHNDSSARAEGNGNRRSDITAKWADRVSKKSSGSKATTKETTVTGATVGGGNATDRPLGLNHTLETLGMEIACALFPSDFNIYEIPASILRRAKEMAQLREKKWSTWHRALSNTPGILDYSRAAIFALIRTAPENIHLAAPGELQAYVNKNLTETNHANPEQEVIAGASGISSTNESEQHFNEEPTATAEVAVVKPETDFVKPATVDVKPVDDPVKSLGDGKFDITALIAPTESAPVQVAETASNEVEKTEVVPESKPEVAEFTDAFPAVFEPGRYEGVSNSAYHSANGISSSMVKDARISLMYFHGRHVTGEIKREVTDALTFGTLVHTLALEPEKLEQEFAIFPGIPAGAFTNTDSLKAFIREFNADKPKADQLKLTGKKEELQEAIRAVQPDAIFADEFEQQWLSDNREKTILSVPQMDMATAIRNALMAHPSVANLLNHPSRVNEVSYFGMDDETGLEVRVRPDIELEIDGIRIAADLKTTSMGRIKQDYLRSRLHREITERDYHVSAAMYSEVAGFDQFFWIFVNKDPGYHWVAVIEASQDLLELGSLEYHHTMNDIACAYDTGVWPAPIVEDYTDELNDFDQRRLEALRMA
nr:RecE family exodeoxyribonuclease [Pantoea cypripedii]